MSWKSIFLSILSITLFVGILIGTIFLFKTHFLMVLLGVVALALPVFVQKKAIDEASGRIDGFIAKWLVPILAVLATFFAIMSLAVWMK